MPLDYSPKKAVNRNRPRKRPIKLYLALILGSVFLVYGLGIATGWLLSVHFRTTDATQPVSVASQSSGADPSFLPPSPSLPVKDPDDKTDLTFFYTLPKGKNAVIGSGINAPSPRIVPGNKAVTPSSPSPSQAQKATTAPAPQTPSTKKEANSKQVAPDEKGSSKQETEKSEQKRDSDKKTYTVQIAACHQQDDARKLKEQLLKDGVAARIEEYNVTGSGVWYRVRAGRKMNKEEAQQLAKKIGNNTIVLEE